MGDYVNNGKQVLHVEGDVRTHIADAGDNEKAHFLATAGNSFGIVSGYVDNALRTLSPGWHGDKVAKAQFLGRINGAIDAANKLDQVKKTLFYGRDNNLIADGQKAVGDDVLDWLGDGNASPANIIHGVIGIFTEAGELLEMLRDAYSGNGFDPINMREEIGDLFWYVAILFAEASRDGDGHTFEDAMRVNIAKLRARFPDKFTEVNANVRDLDAERVILEDARPASEPIPTAIVEAEAASGPEAVNRAAEASAAAFDAVKNVGNDAPPASTSDLGGELAKAPAARAHPLPQENMAQSNAGKRD